LMSHEQVAEVICVSETRLQRLIKHGLVPHKKVGRNMLIGYHVLRRLRTAPANQQLTTRRTQQSETHSTMRQAHNSVAEMVVIQ
jgi:hypothetical protein